MNRPAILKAEESYTFARYFELPYDPEDILAELGYSLLQTRLDLRRSSDALDRLEQRLNQIEEIRPYVSLTSEAARREVLISPILLDLVHYTHAKLKIEYPITVNHQLKGTLDYYLQSQRGCLIVEAKNADLARGFTQLAVELIALSQWTTDPSPILTGAVTTGDLWRFGLLDRAEQTISQDLKLFQVPDDLEDLFRILVAILVGIG